MLPVWVVLTVVALRWLPAASYLFTLPLATAALALLPVVGGRHPSTVRMASLVPVVTALLLWLRPAWSLLDFMVPNLGRQAMITPIYVYPALLLVVAAGLVLPVLAMFSGWTTRLARPGRLTVGFVLMLAGTFALAWFSPAYTNEHPLLRSARYVEDATRGEAFYEISSNEPGMDVSRDAGAPPAWERAAQPAQVSYPLPSLGGPFVYRAGVKPVGEAAATVQSVTESAGADRQVAVTVVPRKPWSTVTLVLSAGVVRWTAASRGSSGASAGRRRSPRRRRAGLSPAPAARRTWAYSRTPASSFRRRAFRAPPTSPACRRGCRASIRLVRAVDCRAGDT